MKYNGWEVELKEEKIKSVKLAKALSDCIDAHKTGQFEPMQIAIERAMVVLDELS